VGGFTLALSPVACEAPTPSTEQQWSLSVAAPERFKVRRDDLSGIDLPASLDAFTSYMREAGSDNYYVTGEGDARSLRAPRPRPSSLCGGTSKAAVYGFPNEERFAPGYLAYVDADGMIDCVEKYFSYLAF
jgi:hypothetical protein